MQSGNTAVVGVPRARSAEQKVEVTVEKHDGVDCVTLRHLTWTEGLGWCCQKTIRMGGEQLDDLHCAITVARHRVRRQQAESGEAPRPAQVIQLPSLS